MCWCEVLAIDGKYQKFCSDLDIEKLDEDEDEVDVITGEKHVDEDDPEFADWQECSPCWLDQWDGSAFAQVLS